MLKKISQVWLQSVSLRCGIGVLLCANAACNSSRTMVSRDPFQPESPQVTFAEPSGQSAAQQPTTDPTAQINSLAQQTAALNASAGTPSTSPGGAEDSGVIRMAEEWPAIPEKRIGMSPPTRQQYVEKSLLPPGGYDKPLSEPDSWPVPKKSPAEQQLAQQSGVQKPAVAPSETQHPADGIQEPTIATVANTIPDDSAVTANPSENLAATSSADASGDDFADFMKYQQQQEQRQSPSLAQSTASSVNATAEAPVANLLVSESPDASSVAASAPETQAVSAAAVSTAAETADPFAA